MVSFGAPLRHPERLERMGHALRHRGPDAGAALRGPQVALGANRLRIVDPGPAGDQPFRDGSGLWLACNGEIYNAPELWRRFGGYPFRSRSDTETILPLYLARGPEGLAQLDGMFALALWDSRSRRLVLARDRAGEKPLFYAEVEGEIWFASEVQALLEHPAVGRELDREALDQFVRLGYVLEPRTLFRAIRRVEAGTLLAFEAGNARTFRYWDPAALEPCEGEGDEDRLASLLERAVAKQLVADVPVGVFASGGLDSSLLVALAAARSSPPLHTFTVRFPRRSYDEGPFAREVARRFGTHHVEVMAGDEELRSAFETLTDRIAEPVADPALLPAWLLAREARRHVGVVLSGEGADELFGGYPTYLGHGLAPWFNRLPSGLRRTAGELVQRAPSSANRVPLEFLLKRFVAHAEKPWLERHLAWFGTGLPAAVGPVDGCMARDLAGDGTAGPVDVLAQAMAWDYRTYLRDNLLPKIDRATMLASLEARAPFLDGALTRFALGLPGNLRLRGFTTKWLLRRVARRWLPRRIVRRRKRGLSVPVASLIDGVLRPEVERLLAPDRLRRQGLFNPEPVGQLVSELRAGRFGHARGIWALVVLQRWLERWT